MHEMFERPARYHEYASEKQRLVRKRNPDHMVPLETEKVEQRETKVVELNKRQLKEDKKWKEVENKYTKELKPAKE